MLSNLVLHEMDLALNLMQVLDKAKTSKIDGRTLEVVHVGLLSLRRAVWPCRCDTGLLDVV